MRAVSEPFSSPGYHTTLTAEIGHVHKTKTAAYYALALLDSGVADYRERAYAVLDQLVATQDANPDHKTFGIWPWFYEEPLTKMSPPDWNWADFIGKAIMLTLKRHSDTLPQELRERMEQALRNACRAIILRNVGPNYTNIAIMGALVTLVSGEWLGDAEVEAYGLARLQRFDDYTMQSGTFQEFNSPAYTTIAIEELSHIHTETGNAVARDLAAKLLDIAWAMVAERFHPRTGQWSGPHTRSYGTLLTDKVLSVLQYGLRGRVSWLDEKALQYQAAWYGNEIRCPEQYVDHFLQARTASLVQPLLQEHSKDRRYAVTHMTEDYTLGTMSRGDLWNQRRSLVAYISTAQGPVYLHLRALHDGYDYAGAQLSASQQDNRCLFGVYFTTDGGDRHPSLDPIQDGTIQARDLRLRFELGGAIDGVDVRWKSPDDTGSTCCTAQIGSIPLLIEVTAAAFANEGIRYEVNREQEVVQLDVILYEGISKPIRLAELDHAFITGQVAIGAVRLDTVTTISEDRCTVRAYQGQARDEPNLSIDVPVRPTSLKEESV
jgi:hypothetical protein